FTFPPTACRLTGYLQEEGLSATSQAFIHESPNLKEYADHTIGDGTIPACVFSVFGKGLTTILNEYVATKTKESCHEVPAVMTSLWKKLDFTLNQIKDTPRKRGGAVSGSSGLARCAMTASTVNPEPQPEEAVDENFPGEIHMSDDAIHDILEQTESDPAFQALYDLFDYNKTRFPEGEPGDGDISSNPEENNTAGPSSAVRPLQSDDPGTTHREANASDSTPMTVKTKAGQERKTRKSTAPTLLKKTILGPSGRASRIENSSPRLLVSHGGASSAAVDSNRKDKGSLFNDSMFVTPMDIDEPLNTPPPPSDSMTALEPASKDSTSTTTALGESTTVPSSTAFAVLEATPASNVDKRQELNQGSKEQHAAAAVALCNQPAFLSPAIVELSSTPASTADLPLMSVSSSGGDSQPVFTLSVTSESASSTSASTAAPFTATPGSIIPVSTSATLTATPAASTLASPASSSTCAPVGAALDPTPSKTAADSNIVSLKIIISDNQDEDSSSDPALTKAISSISGDKIPTIYLSSPAKSPGAPGTPKANLDEAAQAVSGLQNSEVLASPLSSKAGALVASPLTGTSQVQQNYIIQLPLDTTTPALQGATASYFLVTEPPTRDAQTRQMLLSAGVSKGQPLPANQYGVTPTCSQSYSTGSALILPSPVKPVVLPVSVMGQNTLGKVQMVSNQLVAIPNAVSVQQSETVKPKSPAVAIKWSTPAVQKTLKDNTQSATRTKPTILGGNKPKRRIQTVRCSAGPQTDRGPLKESEKPSPPQQHQKDAVKKNSRKQDHSIHNQEPQSASTSRTDASQSESVKKSESGKSKSGDRKHSHDKDGDGAKAKDSHSSRSLSSDSALKSGTRKEKEESSRKELAEKAPAKSREGRAEKRTPSQEMPNVTANKENEIKGSRQEQQQQSTPSSSASRDFSPPAVTQPISTPQSKPPKTPSKTSSLAKQAAEMLHDIQGINSPSTPVKRPVAATSDLSLPRNSGAGSNQEESTDCPRTPSRQKKGKDGEGTPKHLMPPNTPDVPSCSPASEAGSENSINMAAHTLMILSRAAIARTGTPLKDSLRQEGVGEKSPTSSKNSKKRKQSSPAATPPAKKDRERKKLMDCFPHDLDVDKFLSSLHYDE
ncbi:Protein NPAT, partial [Nibea albiflora]